LCENRNFLKILIAPFINFEFKVSSLMSAA
jgi:hypothetical protein